MKTEKMIKKSALSALNGNWVALIFALAVIVFAFLAIQYLASVLLYATGQIDPVTNTSEGVVTEIIDYMLSAVLVFLFPLVNGAIKMLCSTSVSKKTELSEVFYYFKKASIYFKTVALDFLLFFIFSLLSVLTDVYSYGEMITKVSVWKGLFYYDVSPIMGILLLVTVIIRIVIFLLFVHFPLVAFALDDSKSVAKYAFGYIGASFRNFFSSFKLVLSFSGWLISCFLIVPIIFVFPYIGVSAVSSARWLLEIEADRRMIC